MADEKEYSFTELAQLLDVKEATVRRWRAHGRRGVQLAVSNEGEFPGRRGYLVPASSVREFLDRNPKLMTDAMRESLEEHEAAETDVATAEGAVEEAPVAGEGNATGAPAGEVSPALPGYVLRSRALGHAAAYDMHDDLALAAPATDDAERAAAVMRDLLDEKLAERAQLLERLEQVENEIDVLARFVEQA